MTTRDIVVADEQQWRQVKAPKVRYYVHRPETHAYPGVDRWDEASCAAQDHPACMRERPIVTCDEGCGAFQEPRTLDEYKAAYEHWWSHEYLGGCSHGQ